MNNCEFSSEHGVDMCQSTVGKFSMGHTGVRICNTEVEAALQIVRSNIFEQHSHAAFNQFPIFTPTQCAKFMSFGNIEKFLETNFILHYFFFLLPDVFVDFLSNYSLIATRQFALYFGKHSKPVVAIPIGSLWDEQRMGLMNKLAVCGLSSRLRHRRITCVSFAPNLRNFVWKSIQLHIV